jgi:hypothetical protein
MKTAVLCPGPSLANTFAGREGYGLVAGVNRAVHRAPCDVWVSLDPAPIEAIPLTLVTMDATAHQIARRVGPDVRVDTVETESLRTPFDIGGCSWATFSSTAALVAMFTRGAKQIDVYGYDATNAPDFDGASLSTNNRTADRWAHEAQCWEAVTRWLAERGCSVNRIT